ncbi:MAG: hypothetical protein WC479_05885 [Candidatus Izemoplasmatales bacterium]
MKIALIPKRKITAAEEQSVLLSQALSFIQQVFESKLDVTLDTTNLVTHAADTSTHGATGAILATEDVDDTPVDGATTDPISSNWAYDHKADPSAHHVATTRLASKTQTETRDNTAASGNVSYTGYGFTPTALIIFACLNDTVNTSFGHCDSVRVEQVMMYRQEVSQWTHNSNQIVYITSALAANRQTAIVASYDADGFTLTWTKSGTPSAGTIAMMVIAVR